MWVTTSDVDEFLAVAGPSLRARPVENTLLLTIADAVRTRGRHVYGDRAPVFGWHTAGAAFVWTPPRPLLLSAADDDAAAALADTLDATVPAVNSTEPAARAFSAAWCRRTGATVTPGRRSRLYRLEELAKPDVVGAARVADPGDRDLLVAWLTAFSDEIGEPPHGLAESVDARLAHGALTLWEADSAPVAVAGFNGPAGGVVRVGPVYTPPSARRHGYGSAVTAAVSAAARPHEVVLFTDLANPTSNSIYTKLGYRPVEDRLILAF